MSDLTWLPEMPEWDRLLDSLSVEPLDEQWRQLPRLGNYRLDFVQTGKLDRFAQRLAKQGIPKEANLKPIKLALLGSSTLRHLIPGIRVAGLRRGYWVAVFDGEYGQYLQELTDANSALHEFSPNTICFSFDAEHLYSIGNGKAEGALDHVRSVWSLAKSSFSCNVIQQSALPIFPDLLGNNEHRLPDSPQSCIAMFNGKLREIADRDRVDLLALDKYAALEGIRTWHDATLWHKSKQEIHPAVSHKYGEYVMRIVAAEYGRSFKCLALDLDNTLWGGVIGDDGISGIKLGSGSAVGEAYLGFQRYLLRLKERGILLAVCSKNDSENAILPFDLHPEMLLKRRDIACFVANWKDKATNLKTIASTLNIGIDSLVFVDDNPFERGLVRDQLPQVAVPELPEDPAGYIEVLADASYFEATSLTHEDRQRSVLYQANAERESLKSSVIDLASYLKGLQMELICQPFDEANLQRIVQLINKTNQFNLTTRRYSESEVRFLMDDHDSLTWQFRLKDRFGDNGIIAVVIGRKNPSKELDLETWLMSCRVLGRQVEDATMNLVVKTVRELGYVRMTGVYRPTAKNPMVREIYSKFGFQPAGADLDGNPRWMLELDDYRIRETFITISEVALHAR